MTLTKCCLIGGKKPKKQETTNKQTNKPKKKEKEKKKRKKTPKTRKDVLKMILLSFLRCIDEFCHHNFLCYIFVS